MQQQAGLFPRFSADKVREALADTPVVLVNGPRQSGKTTLARQFAGDGKVWLSLDDETLLNAALADPVGFLRGHDTVVIDEVQRAPALLRAIKHSVDGNRRPGRFLLTGSTDVLTLPGLSESLAGRMAVVELLPLAQAELAGQRPSFLEQVFAGEPPAAAPGENGPVLMERVLRGGYPEMILRPTPVRRQAWARDYVRAIVQRDVRDIAAIDKLDKLPHLLRALAQHSGQLTHFSQLGGLLSLDEKTVRKYLGVFEQLYLVRRVEPWFRNRLKRLIKTPKLRFLDSGLLASVRGLSAERIARDRRSFDSLLETFVYAELLKLASWQNDPCAIHHYRDKDQVEVDFVLEADSGDVVGVEVKAAASVNLSDFAGLRKLANACGSDFRAGVLLYDGESVAPFGARLYAVPFGSLWSER